MPLDILKFSSQAPFIEALVHDPVPSRAVSLVALNTSVHHQMHTDNSTKKITKLNAAQLEIITKPLCNAPSCPGSFADTGRGSEQSADEK